MSELLELSGTVQRFLFRNQENGFCVCLIHVPKQAQPTLATGCLPEVQAGQQVTMQGTWTMHPKFGRQFTITRYTTSLPTTTAGLKAYLSSGLIKGIGPAYAEKLVNHFGSDVLTVIDKNPHRLQEIPGIGHMRTTMITNAWKDQREVANIMVFLQDKGISTTYAAKMYKKYGVHTIATLQENPYRIAEDIWGIGFKTADQIAHNLGIDAASIQRVRAGILHVLSTATHNGHLYCELTTLRTQTYTLLQLEESLAQDLAKRALHDLHEQGKIKVVTFEHQHYITLTQLYLCEQGIAKKLRALQNFDQSLGVIKKLDIHKIYQELRSTHNKHDVELNEQQQEGVMTCLQNKITIITGGPGTGKTTLIKKLLHILDAHTISYKLAAPTGRAAKRITESTGRYAMTIHRLLEFDVATRSFSYNETNALKVSMLIIDESSMLDVFLGHAILRALPLHAQLVFIGDIDQLPSVGAGNFLHDLIASTVIPTVRLTTIFRQAQDSLIVTNAHRINDGEFPLRPSRTERQDYIFIEEEDAAQLPEHFKAIFGRALARYGIACKDAMVLTPMNRGAAGTQMINDTLQRLLNPGGNLQASVTYAHACYRIGDPVMQMRNNYDKNVFNGDMGVIRDVNTAEKIVTIQFQDLEVHYEWNELDEITLAYAATIHKSQGSEYKAVIVPIFMQHYMMLRRNLIYTAITRAKKLCIFIGQPKALALAIKNKNDGTRITFLRHYLTSDLACL